MSREGDTNLDKIRILIAEDHVVVREGTRRILEQEHDLEVVGEAGDGEEAVTLAQELVFPHVEMLARGAGADQVELLMSRTDHWASVLRGNQAKIYLGTDLLFSATGRPSPARR